MTHNPNHPAGGAGAVKMPDDVGRLVTAARAFVYSDPFPEDKAELDKALEAFAERVPWTDEPDDGSPTPVPEPFDPFILSPHVAALAEVLGHLGNVITSDWSQDAQAALDKLTAITNRISPVPEPEAEGEAVAWVQREVLAELGRHKDATATVASGLLKKPFGDPVALYTRPSSEAEITDLRARLKGLRRALERITTPTSPERLSGAHLTEAGRGQLAFAMIDNFQTTARQALSLAGEEKTGASDV